MLASPDRERPDCPVAVVARAIEAAGARVHVLRLDPRCADAVHEQRLLATLADASSRARGPRILGGFSLGARIAAQVAEQAGADALLGLGYPFHVLGEPARRPGLDALTRVRVPTRIIQGTRDAHGSEADVRGYGLPEWIEMSWVRDANHRLVGRGRVEIHEQVGAAAVEFVCAIAGEVGAIGPP